MTEALNPKEAQTLNRLINQVEAMLEIVANIEKVAAPSLQREHYYSDSEMSAILRVSRRTLADWRRKGILSFLILEGKVLYKSSDVIELLEKNYYKAFK